MPPQPRLFPAPLRRYTFVAMSDAGDGYVTLRVFRGEDQQNAGVWERYERCTPGEALDVIESTVGDEFGF